MVTSVEPAVWAGRTSSNHTGRDSASVGRGRRHHRVGGEALAEAVAATLGVPVVAAQFYEPGVGGVVGLDLADGRAVVAKVHRATFVPRERLAAAQVGSSGQPVKVGSAVTGLAVGATGTMSWPSSCASPWSWPLPWSWPPSSPWSWPS
jgi:hypothetical protein